MKNCEHHLQVYFCCEFMFDQIIQVYDSQNCRTVFFLFILTFISDIDECSSFPCQHNGTCTDLIDRYTCQCQPGYKGYSCEIGKTNMYVI